MPGCFLEISGFFRQVWVGVEHRRELWALKFIVSHEFWVSLARAFSVCFNQGPIITSRSCFQFGLHAYLFLLLFVCCSLYKCRGFDTSAYVCPCRHTPQLRRRELFEWQVGGMAASDCADNGILVSLQIVPQEMAENCFWIKVKEEKFENPDLFAQLSLCFSSQSKGKEASSRFTPSLINLHTHASFSLPGNRCQATFILWHFKKQFFSLKC